MSGGGAEILLIVFTIFIKIFFLFKERLVKLAQLKIDLFMFKY